MKDPKFSIDDTVYSFAKRKKVTVCESCGGLKKITVKTLDDKEINIPCPTCEGKGVISDGQQTEVVEGVVQSIKIAIMRDSSMHITYKFDEVGMKNRNEELCFSNFDDADKRLKEGLITF